jgi:hypothetical protein
VTREDTDVVIDSKAHKRSGAHGLPAEFYLPPQSNTALWRETWRLVLGCLTFLLVLGIIVASTQGIVLKVG